MMFEENDEIPKNQDVEHTLEYSLFKTNTPQITCLLQLYNFIMSETETHKHAVVTGGLGFIGKHLVRKIASIYIKVTVLDSGFSSEPDTETSFPPNVNVSNIDICQEWPPLENVDAIFHLACPASPKTYSKDPLFTLDTCFIGTRNALKCAAKHSARLLFTSTSEIYGSPIQHPQTEDSFGKVPLSGARSSYDEGKRCAESLISNFKSETKSVDYRIVRIFNTYGPGMALHDGRVIPNFIKAIKNEQNLPIYGSGLQTRSFCYVDDLVDGIIKVFNYQEQDASSPFNLGNPQEISILDLAYAFQSLLKRPLDFKYLPCPLHDPPRRLPNISRAIDKLGWKPKIDLLTGLQTTLTSWDLSLPGNSGNSGNSTNSQLLKPKPKPIVYTVTRNYYPFLLASLQSLSDTTSQSINIKIYYDFTVNPFPKFKNLVLTFHKKDFNGKVSQFRLSLAKRIHEPFIYCDSDILFLKDPVHQLLNFQLYTPIAAVQDFGIPFIPDRCLELYKSQKPPSHSRYFNSGIILIDPTMWNKLKITEKCLDILNSHHNLVFSEQDALNSIGIPCHFLNSEWNVHGIDTYTKLPIPQSPGVIHFTGPLFMSKDSLPFTLYGPKFLKPLNPKSTCSHQKEWFNSLKKSMKLDHKQKLPPFRSWAIILPLKTPEMSTFIDSFKKTVDSSYFHHFHFYVGIDKNLDHERKVIKSLSPFQCTFYDTTLLSGKICVIWKKLASLAYHSKSFNHDFFVLFGDDIKLQTDDWPQKASLQFWTKDDSHSTCEFGIVAFWDETFPGFPTFPIVPRSHMDIFDGHIFGDIFVNQDADPYLFQLYRKFGLSKVVPKIKLCNMIGGSDDARYEKEHVDWSSSVLSNGRDIISRYYIQNSLPFKPLITLDIVVPTYRVPLNILGQIANLKPDPTLGVSVGFIFIVDDPDSPNIPLIQQGYKNRSDVRIRTNLINSGASFSRNRGIEESSADWILFLDDDIMPEPNLLTEYVINIQKHQENPNVGGFVGHTKFPHPYSPFSRAVFLSDVTYFYRVAQNFPEPAWGVTANLVARRDSTRFRLEYPKTGGGEDIHYCCEHPGKFLSVPSAKVTHPYWNNGQRQYRHFFNWGMGDGQLVDSFPEFTYICWPTMPETLFLYFFFLFPFLFLVSDGNISAFRLLFTLIWVIGTGYIYNAVFHCYLDSSRLPDLKGIPRLFAACEAWTIVNALEISHFLGHLVRRRFNILRRFDWFCNTFKDAIPHEQTKYWHLFLINLFGLFLFEASLYFWL